MASKTIFLVAVLCAMQVVHAASVEKRDVFTDTFNYFVNITQQIQQQILAGINQAQSMIQGVETQINSQIATATAGMVNTTAAILTQASNFPRCANAQTASAANFINQTSINIQNCAVSPIVKLVSAFSNLMSLSSQATQLSQDIQAAINPLNYLNPFNLPNIPSLFSNITTRIANLAGSLANDTVELTTVGPQEIAQIPTCGANVAATAIQQLNTIAANVQSCVSQSG